MNVAGTSRSLGEDVFRLRLRDLEGVGDQPAGVAVGMCERDRGDASLASHAVDREMIRTSASRQMEDGMGVYVDEPIYERWGIRWCHLTADTTEELHAFAAGLGLQRSRFQTKPGRPWVDHYDITADRRDRAVAMGAKEITLKEAGAQLARKRRTAQAQLDREP